MRRAFSIALLAAVSLIPAAAFAQSRGNSTVEGFGGLSMNGFETHSPSLGGTLTFNIVPGVQVIGEAGRIGNVLPTLADTIFTAARTDLRASAFYGEGGVRFIAPTGAVAPYAEATAGIARLDVSSTRFGTIGNAVSDVALGFAGRTTPLAGFGGGVLLRGGPIVFDVGYRYKQLFPNAVVETALGLGQPLRTHQVRAGIGVRF
jgi:opacity protein-like surface antigen